MGQVLIQKSLCFDCAWNPNSEMGKLRLTQPLVFLDRLKELCANRNVPCHTSGTLFCAGYAQWHKATFGE